MNASKPDTPPLSTLDRLLAIEEIKTLKARYFRFVDGKDQTGLASLFTPDGILDMRHAPAGPPDESALISGADEIARFILTAVSGARTVHHGHMPEITITSPDTATAIWAMQDLLKWGDKSPYPFRELIGYGYYHDTYRRVVGQWRIRSSKLTRLRVDLV